MNLIYTRLISKDLIKLYLMKISNMLLVYLIMMLEVKFLGLNNFGVWAILASIISWLELADSGLGSELRNRVAKYTALEDGAQLTIDITSSIKIFGIIIGLAISLLFSVSFLLSWKSIILKSVELENFNTLITVLFTSALLSIFFKISNALYLGRQNFLRPAFVQLLSNTTILLVVILLRNRLTVMSLAWTYLSLVGILCWNFKEVLTELQINWKSFQLATLKRGAAILKSGMKFFFLQISVLILFSTDNIIIGRILTPKDVSEYHLAFKMFGSVATIYSFSLTPIWSRVTHLYHLEKYSEMAIVYRKQILLILPFAFLAILLSIFYNSIILYFTDGLTYSVGYRGALVLLILIMMWNNIHSIILNGVGDVGFQTMLSLTGALINIPLTIKLIKMFGTSGALYSTILVSLPFSIYGRLKVKRYVKGINSNSDL